MIPAGTTVGGFRVEHLVGKGGMASVYRAVQVRLDRPVALKVLNPALAADEQFFQRFQLEGINAARLDHPNVVPVYEAGEDGTYAFLAMKLIDGETFSTVISRRESVDPSEALPILADVARALDYAHGMGFLHRDVKPANVLIDRGGHVYLSDFGLSKDIGRRGLTGTGQFMGTAEYMPPEQAAGKPVDHRADLYALGCVAFECLTGDPPYLADNAMAVMMAHTSADIPSASVKNRSLSEDVDAVLRRAMAKDPVERFTSALALVESLQAAIEGRELTPEGEPVDGFTMSTDAPPRPTPPPAPPPVVTPQWPTSVPPQAPSILYCPRCAGLVEADDVFCGGCGIRILWCPACRGPRVATDRFCPTCGSATPAIERG